MIPTDADISSIRQSIEAAAGLDEELQRRCGQMIHIGAFNEAILNAFVLLEERLRNAIGKDGMTGVQLANNAFAPDGPLSKHLGHTTSEKEGLRELYSGAFKLFRNPAAHSMVSYSSAEAKSIIGLVNLLLLILARAGNLHGLDLFPANVEAALLDAEKLLGTGTASRLRAFLGKCVTAGLKPVASASQWIPFRRHALVQYDHWPQAKPYPLTVFYVVRRKEIGLWFPLNQYYSNVKGLDLTTVDHELKPLGFTPTGNIKTITSNCTKVTLRRSSMD
jgi:uncharacterized protein (TIGR02391 family)